MSADESAQASSHPQADWDEAERKPENGFLAGLGAPARRALEAKGITTLGTLASYTEAQILELHGVGPSSMPRLREALKRAGLAFRRS